MKISIFGLGYVGAVSAGCLANEGHTVIGVDPYQRKVELIESGQTPVIEKEIDEIISKAVSAGKLTATHDVAHAIRDTSVSLICVGTPSLPNGSLDLKYVQNVCEQIGEALKDKKEYHVVVARSTLLPGSMANVVIPVLEQTSGKKAGVDFGVCNNPEFLREGTAVYDFYNPPKTVIGETDKRSGDIVTSIYEKLEAPVIRTDVETAEMVKYSDNVWHALKVCFANEIGNICKALKIDGHQVMNIFCQDTKLNLSAYYMKPGFAFGGSCLPKDVRALTYRARSMDLELPIINAIMPSNVLQVEKGVKMIMATGDKKIGILGFSFKGGTDDLRESPIVDVIERLIGKGYDVKLYDKNVNIAALVGANRDYILNVVPHISQLMEDSIDAVLDHADTLVIGNSSSEFISIMDRLKEGQKVIDFVGITGTGIDRAEYNGICW